MKAAIDSAGRVVIPKRIREEANLKAGTPLEINCRVGRIDIQPAPLRVRLVRRGRLVVALPVKRPARLTAEKVEGAREAIHRERAGKS